MTDEVLPVLRAIQAVNNEKQREMAQDVQSVCVPNWKKSKTYWQNLLKKINKTILHYMQHFLQIGRAKLLLNYCCTVQRVMVKCKKMIRIGVSMYWTKPLCLRSSNSALSFIHTGPFYHKSHAVGETGGNCNTHSDTFFIKIL